jgi:hypothetical protein
MKIVKIQKNGVKCIYVYVCVYFPIWVIMRHETHDWQPIKLEGMACMHLLWTFVHYFCMEFNPLTPALLSIFFYMYVRNTEAEDYRVPTLIGPALPSLAGRDVSGVEAWFFTWWELQKGMSFQLNSSCPAASYCQLRRASHALTLECPSRLSNLNNKQSAGHERTFFWQV